MVSLYCLYGAHSKSQFHGCIRHVSANYVARAQTSAARFARAEPLVCGYGSGPYCSVKEAVRLTKVAMTTALPQP